MSATGSRIRQIRGKASLVSFGEKLGLSKSAVHQYEQGAATPTLETLVKIAELGSVTLDWLITGREPAQKPAELTDEEIAGQILARPRLRDQVISQAREQVREERSAYGDPVVRELLAICQRLPEDDRVSLLKTARGFDMVNESRKSAEEGSGSAERNSA